MSYYGTANIQDRTLEFQQCVNTFARQGGRGGNKYQPEPLQGKADGKPLSKSEFTRNASVIAKNIARVTGSLAKLAQLAKRKQLFNDRPTDIIELTYVIKQDIFRIEKELKTLQQQANSGKGTSDTQIVLYNKNVVQLLNTKTKNISETFKEVLQVRQRNELAQRSRQEQLLAAVKPDADGVSSGRASMDSNGQHGADGSNRVPYALRSRRTAGESPTNSENPFLASFSSNLAADPDVSDISQLNGLGKDGDILALPDQSQQMMLLEEQDSRYLQERNNAVDIIESTINEVGGLFQQLATMVQEQGEVIQRIDNNVEDVSLNIGGAQRELLKYYNNISNNRWLMLKIFGILIVFFLLWVLIS
ncbi:DEKNAAC105580 [Brettanomyces naardenensis]|uniref:DEKNAAC105580 n=1 Tax=Brettanomyces naardenensis TaxID=13370 RepID=A0A448YTQ7_BRENA|nr:DEKNAAC105580 [Brettanomyces naardenensis]